MQLRYFLYELILLIPLSSGETSCVSQRECNDQNSINCGICIDSSTPRVGKCIFPFVKVYKPDKSCSKFTACDNNCENHGECITESDRILEILPTCKCYEDFYGRTCQHSVTKDLSGAFFRCVEVLFESLKRPVEVYFKKLSLHCGFKNRAAQGYLEVISGDDGHYEKISIDGNDCENKEWKTYSYETRYRFLPLNDEKDNKVVKLGNDVVGYVSWCKVTVVVRGIINYQDKFPVFVSYSVSNLICAPVVKLLNCASSKSNADTTTRQHPVRVESRVYFIANGKYTLSSKLKSDCEEVANYLWKVWKNKDSDSEIAILTINKEKFLNFNPFQLEIGNYRILLEVTSVQEKSSQNYAYCYFKVQFESLVAIIDGGSERVVQKNLGLVLMTTRSKDPNMPPNEQGHVKASWSCVDVLDDNREICDPSQLLSVSNSLSVSSKKLNYGAVINITLKVWTDYYKNCEECGTVRPAFAHATIIVANLSEAEHDDIFIECLLNCKEQVVSSEQLYLKVKKINGTIKENYEWTYFEQGKAKEIGTGTIAEQGLPNFMLLVKQNAFSKGKNYTIVVRTKKDVLLAKYSIETIDVKFGGNCSMDPMDGIRGLSIFNIVCQNFTTTGKSSSFLYEFYDKSSEEAQEGRVFSGRMMGTSKDGELRDFKVTRGHVFVYIKDDSGILTQIQFTVNLTHWHVNEEVVEEIFKNISKSREEQDYDKMVENISIIPDIVPAELNKRKILERLLNFVVDIPTNTISEVKSTSSTLYNAISKFNKPVRLELDINLMNTVVNTILNQVKLLSSTVRIGTELKGMSSDEIKLLASTILSCLYDILACKDPRTFEVNELDLDFETENKLMQISNSASEVIYLVQNVLTFLQRRGIPPIKVSSEGNNYVVWALTNDPDYDLTNYLTGSNGLPVRVSKYFLREFGNKTNKSLDEFTLRIATLDNIYWWRRPNVKSNLVSVSLVKQSQRKKLRTIKVVSSPLDIEINLNHGLVNSSEISDITFHYPFITKCSLDLDQSVKIHRLDPAPKSLITLRFIFPPTNGSLQVLVYKNHRPECDMMKRAVTISEHSPNYPPVLVQPHEPTFYYVGIIPGPSYVNDSVRYTFQVNTTVCQHWVRGYWSVEGCKISQSKTKDLEVHCNCDHFSIFAAAFPVPPQKIDPFSDIGLFLTVFDNPVVVIFVSVVLLIYLIACLWAFCKDRNDKLLRNVVILADNFPGDRCPYLVAVYTSSRFNAGTTAHVGIQIIGSLATSRAHILASSVRKTLKRNYDDWFLIYYSEPLGELNSIHIWHDNAGSSPDWFCDKIVVYDLRENVDATFVVEDWFALRPNCYPEAIISSATISEVKNMKRLFLDNCVLGVREGHILLSIVFRHPRSAMSRLQKISVLMCCVMVAMLCNIMFYSPDVDDDGYKVGMRDFYISIQSLIISVGITFIILFAFKRSYTYTYQRHRSVSLYKRSTFQECDPLQNIRNRSTFYASYVRFVSKRLKGRPLVPVHMAESKSVVSKRRGCIVIAWISCISLILTCSFLVILYGLKLGVVKSKKWLSSVFFTVSGELVIAGPVKIILVSILLSLAFQKTSETSTHRVYLEEAIEVKDSAKMEQYELLSAKRNYPMYAPLRQTAIDEMIRKKKLRERIHFVIDFVVSLCFIIVLNVNIYELWTAHYNTNKHVNDIVNHPHALKIGSEPLSAVRNVSQMENHLRQSLIRSLYERCWYNGVPIVEEGVARGYWQSDFTLRKVGLERLRQIRVTPVRCIAQFINTTRRCIPRWDINNEDTQDYSVKWGIANWHDLRKNNSIWRYTKSSLGMVYTMYRLYGRSGTLYHDGGYLTHLGPESSTAEITVADTITNKWQDQLTSAVFVEFTLFNVNENLFSQVTIIVEYLITGNIQLKIGVVSVKSQIKPSVWTVLLAAFLMYYVVQSGNAINRQGLMEFLARSSNRTQVLLIIVGLLCFVVAFVHHFSSATIYDKFIENGRSSFFDFDSYVIYFLILNKCLPVLFCLATVRLVLLLHSGTSLLNMFYSIELAVPGILSLTLVILLFLLLQLHFLLSLNMYSFHTYVGVIIGPDCCDQYTNKSTGVFFLVKSLFGSVMLKFYFVIFTHSFKIARSHRVGLQEANQLGLTACIFDKLRRKKKT